MDSGRGATGGGQVRGGGDVRAVVCDPVYPDRFRELEIGGSFVVDGGDPSQAVDDAVTAWSADGWRPETTDDGRVLLEAEVGEGVRTVVVATIERPSAGSDVVVVSVSAATVCLELPESAP